MCCHFYSYFNLITPHTEFDVLDESHSENASEVEGEEEEEPEDGDNFEEELVSA